MFLENMKISNQVKKTSFDSQKKYEIKNNNANESNHKTEFDTDIFMRVFIIKQLKV